MSTPHLRGFTLIELLVVVAILGILSAVVLGSLNTARSKGQDAAVRSNLAAARSQAELYHDANTNSFEGVCDDTVGVNGVLPIYLAVSTAAKTVGAGGVVGTGPTTLVSATCNDDTTQWAAEAALVTGGFYCVDSVGHAATSTASLLDTGEMVCE